MLNEIQKRQNFEKYVGYLEKLGLATEEFSDYLKSIQYFDAPFSAQYTGSYAGGLCEYALKLVEALKGLCEVYFPNKYTEEDILKVALFKEIYRAVMYQAYFRNVKNDATGQWETVLAYKTREDRPVYGDLGFSSYMLMKKFTTFTDEQIEAIIHSTGLNNYSVDIHDVLKEYPLVTLTKMADLAITNF